MSSDELNVWRDGRVIARLTRVANGVSLEYASDVTSPISVSLPIGQPLGVELPKRWLINLLPENNEVRRALADQINLGSNSLWELLHYIGGDVAGDIAILPLDATVDSLSRDIVPVDEQMIVDMIHKAKSGSVRSIVKWGDRLSLAGMQTKFSLTLTDNGWMKSTYLTPSTHIFKPGGIPNIEELEAAAQTLAQRIGLRAADAGVASFGDQTSYVTVRFDRAFDQSTGKIIRIPQEDLAQVIGISKGDKYNTTFKDIIYILQSSGLPTDEIYTFIKQIVFNVHVGNTDAHSKNYSVTYTRGGSLSMTPLYDCVPVLGYGGKYSKKGLAMSINGKTDPRSITAEDWLTWSLSNNLDAYRVQRIVKEVVTGIRENAQDVFDSLNVPRQHTLALLDASKSIV